MSVTKLPTIPDKKYFSISEVSILCRLKPHTLRFWEKEFSQLKPSTRKGGRRAYTGQDILLIRKIRKLLYEEGLTIKGVRKSLLNKNTKSVSSSNEVAIKDLELILEEIKEVI